MRLLATRRIRKEGKEMNTEVHTQQLKELTKLTGLDEIEATDRLGYFTIPLFAAVPAGWTLAGHASGKKTVRKLRTDSVHFGREASGKNEVLPSAYEIQHGLNREGK